MINDLKEENHKLRIQLSLASSDPSAPLDEKGLILNPLKK